MCVAVFLGSSVATRNKSAKRDLLRSTEGVFLKKTSRLKSSSS